MDAELWVLAFGDAVPSLGDIVLASLPNSHSKISGLRGGARTSTPIPVAVSSAEAAVIFVLI